VVFPHIQDVLSLEDWRELDIDNAIEAVSKPLFNVPVQREYLKLSRKLRRSSRRAIETSVLGQMVGLDTTLQSIDVLATARKQASTSAQERLRQAVKDSRAYFRSAPLTAPGKCAVNNLRLTVNFLSDLNLIRSDVSDDLTEIGREYRERLKLVLGDN